MHKLTYWKIDCPNDSDVYSIRAKTKKDALRQLDALTHWHSYSPKPVKVTIEYRDAFDLMDQCSNEGHHWWEVS